MAEFQLPPEAERLLVSVREAEQLMARLREEAEHDLERVRAEITALSAEFETRRSALEALLRDRVDGFEFIARAWADYELALARSEAKALASKKHPAKKAAATLRERGRELAEARRRAKLAEWIVALYEFHFPWLPELRNVEEEQAYVAGEDEPGDEKGVDPAGRWLSADEWSALSTVERNQRALDRYLASRKTPWQIGRDYERFIGYLREQEGWSVPIRASSRAWRTSDATSSLSGTG